MPSFQESNGVFILNSDDDASYLPTENIIPGWVAIVADETAHMYMVNNDHEWAPFGWDGA